MKIWIHLKSSDSEIESSNFVWKILLGQGVPLLFFQSNYWLGFWSFSILGWDFFRPRIFSSKVVTAFSGLAGLCLSALVYTQWASYNGVLLFTLDVPILFKKIAYDNWTHYIKVTENLSFSLTNLMISW